MAYDCIPIEYAPGMMCTLVTTSATGIPSQMLNPKQHTGKATAGGATTIDLQVSGSSALANLYTGWTIRTIAGTGIGQERVVTAYVAANLRCTVATWAVNPDNTTIYTITPPFEGLQCRELLISTITQTTLFLINGGTPTATVGHTLAAGANIVLKGVQAITNFKIIDGAGAATVMVTGCYG